MGSPEFAMKTPWKDLKCHVRGQISKDRKDMKVEIWKIIMTGMRKNWKVAI